MALTKVTGDLIKTTPSISVPLLNIDWSQGLVFFKTISANSTFTFSNVEDGKVITLSVKNTSASNVTITLPSGLWRDSSVDLTVEPSKKNVYTFIRENGETSVSFVSKLTNV